MENFEKVSNSSPKKIAQELITLFSPIRETFELDDLIAHRDWESYHLGKEDVAVYITGPMDQEMVETLKAKIPNLNTKDASLFRFEFIDPGPTKESPNRNEDGLVVLIKNNIN